eukprot:6084374-Alexandrium_andersonii.AAC.1
MRRPVCHCAKSAQLSQWIFEFLITCEWSVHRIRRRAWYACACLCGQASCTWLMAFAYSVCFQENTIFSSLINGAGGAGEIAPVTHSHCWPERAAR